ncbi:MAG: ABC transporter ATP-binding protein [Anaerolineae bacterium]|nr:ABC transporter ATP-binding protein [Anaerolineae bacterium]MCO5203815.1 ABC transporter ATP-binding protein [Anaerolineae bacterium]
MIKTNALTKQFDEHIAVDSLDLDIADGELFGFLGPNGAGKTTTVRMLTSLIAPTSGTAVVGGFKLGEDDQNIRRNVGILTETPGMYDRLSAHRNLSIYAELYEVEQVERQVEKYLKMLGLWERRDDPVGTFSKGMRQKLAIARSMLHEPKTLFLDEPTSGLDPEAAKLVRDFIEDLKEAGRTIFLCTHNLDEADRLCDRIAVFNGKLRVVDTPTSLRHSLFGNQVVVQLAASAEFYTSNLTSLPFVKECVADGNRLLLQMDDPAANNPELIRVLVSADAPIQFVSEQTHSLEDIYLELVNDK